MEFERFLHLVVKKLKSNDIEGVYCPPKMRLEKKVYSLALEMHSLESYILHAAHWQFGMALNGLSKTEIKNTKHTQQPF